MKIEFAVKPKAVIAYLEGELDMHTAEYFKQAIENKLRDTGMEHLILNLQGVTFIDSSGLGAILGRYRRINQSGGKVLAVAPKESVAKLLEMSGIVKIIPLLSSDEMALKSL